MQFRKDINGLRAIAVIAVVLFHFNASWMPGGFAGVDVFFVISGFLMTGIIFRGIEQENFSILKFYVARANRIIPALAVLCLVLLVFGWFYLTPLDYRALGKHVGSSMGFLSNIIYWRESGYFDAASHEKWLLHTWSLSAEWQFYIIYPLVLVAMRKFMSLKAMKATVLVGTVLGFIFCVVATYKWPNPAYYLLPTRAWEMMIGGVAYLYPLKLAENRKKVFEWVGLALIILSYIFISKENLWPGYLALIPVFGAFLLIQAQRNDSIVTGNIIFQSLGKWSYSIYLWHWPLVVAIYYFSLPEQFIYFGLILSIILGFISNRYVESINFRNDFNGVFSYLKFKPVYLCVFVAFLGSYTFFTDGVKYKYTQDIISILDYSDTQVGLLDEFEKELKSGCDLRSFDKPNCHRLENGHYDVIVLGDSHAGAISTGINESLIRFNPNAKMVNAGAPGCLPVLGMKHRDKTRDYCKDYNRTIYNLINDKYNKTPIIIAARLNLYPFGFNENGEINKPYMYFEKDIFDDDYKLDFKNNFVNSMCKLSIKNPVYIIKPVPEFGFSIPNEIIKQKIVNREINIEMSVKDYNDRNDYIESVLKSVKNNCDVEIIDTTNAFINKRGMLSPISEYGMPMYVDDNHLNVLGASNISSFFDYIWSDMN
ncbi:acyltransferase [Vibrio fluvialis]|nr:acyltransferase [Vibrio fluvialis]